MTRPHGRWFRFYADALHHPKIQRLPPHLFKMWVNLLCVCAERDGNLPSEADVAFMLGRRRGDVRRDVAALLARRLLDVKDGVTVPHDWDSLQFKSDVSTQRVKDHRKRSNGVSHNVSGNGTETPPDTDSETETERKKKKDGANAPTLANLPIADPTEQERQFFNRAHEVLKSRALGRKLLSAKSNNVAAARSALEAASTKSSPAEYVGRIIAGQSSSADDVDGNGDPIWRPVNGQI